MQPLRHGRYGPHTGPPPGGLCISAFAVLRQGERVLAVQPRRHERWGEWAPNWSLYTPEQLEREFRTWRLPCSYVYEGEAPESAVRRVLEDQLGATVARLGEPTVWNFYEPSSRIPGQMHWDLCFVFEADAEVAPAARLPWLAERRWVGPTDLAAEDFGSAIGDLARALGLAR